MDLEECIGNSKEVHRCFFHAFIMFGSTKLFKEYVIAPNKSNQAALAHQHENNIAGCHGGPLAVRMRFILCPKGYVISVEISILASK